MMGNIMDLLFDSKTELKVKIFQTSKRPIYETSYPPGQAATVEINPVFHIKEKQLCTLPKYYTNPTRKRTTTAFYLLKRVLWLVRDSKDHGSIFGFSFFFTTFC